MISKTEDLIKKVMLKARQLTETSLEKIFEKDIQNKYAEHKNHFTFLFKATIFYVFFANTPLKKPLPVSLYRGV